MAFQFKLRTSQFSLYINVHYVHDVGLHVLMHCVLALGLLRADQDQHHGYSCHTSIHVLKTSQMYTL